MTSFDPRERKGDTGLRRNKLLASLPDADLALLAPHARCLAARRGEVLFNPGQEIDAVFMPCGAVVSIVVATPDGRTAEAAIVGSEGAIGGLATATRHPAFGRAVVQVPGDIVAISLCAIEEAKAASPALTDALARFADCLIAQLLQTIACNVRHQLDQRLARWLLSLRSYVGADMLPMTQEYLAEILGVQRTTVTACASQFQARGLIRYSRGRIWILDAEGLGQASCNCHVGVQRHYAALLPNARERPPER